MSVNIIKFLNGGQYPNISLATPNRSVAGLRTFAVNTEQRSEFCINGVVLIFLEGL